eukprot:7814913-Pyramimonas_sp.AAC.1
MEEFAAPVPKQDLDWFFGQLPSLDPSVTRDIDVALENIPPLAWWQQALLHAEDSAEGPDGISGSIVKRCAHILAAVHQPFAVKSTVRVCEPVQWKGGLFVFDWRPLPGHQLQIHVGPFADRQKAQ